MSPSRFRHPGVRARLPRLARDRETRRAPDVVLVVRADDDDVRHRRQGATAQATAAAVNLTTNLALIPTLGGLGAALATLAAESTALAVYVVSLRRPRPEQPGSLAVAP